MKHVARFLKTKRRGVEIIHCEDGCFCALLHDASGASAEGFGASPDEAFLSAQAAYQEAQRRAKLTTARYPRRPYVVTLCR